jgi:4-alpha-glucanotransferase
MPTIRASGILLHPTSLPGRFGIGDLGTEAYRFIDFLAGSGQQYWQVLPLGPTGFGNSPYMCYSALAGNPLLVSLDILRDRGFLDERDFIGMIVFPEDKVEFDRVSEVKLALLRKACERFTNNASWEDREQFKQFCHSKANWLDDYALFMALKQDNEGKSWHQWEPELSRRDPEALSKCSMRLASEIYYHKYLQFEFFRQWSDLKRYANDRGIAIIGDIPIYVAHDSADVWSRPENFVLDVKTGAPAMMAGVPPDYFSATGQLWGNPIYNWGTLKKTQFAWWVDRFRALLDYIDVIRIDHFRGFEAFWAVPMGSDTALRGKWVKALGMEFFETLRQELGNVPVLAEDLGLITPAVEELRDHFEFPGMKVLHFAFGSDAANPFLPFNLVRNCVIYTGTHDNDTTCGWFANREDWERDAILRYIGHVSPDGIHWDLIRLALSSVANLAIFPIQDILGLGTEARMNFPSKPEGNWEWRYRPGMLTDELRDRLRTMTSTFGRAPW